MGRCRWKFWGPAVTSVSVGRLLLTAAGENKQRAGMRKQEQNVKEASRRSKGYVCSIIYTICAHTAPNGKRAGICNALSSFLLPVVRRAFPIHSIPFSRPRARLREEKSTAVRAAPILDFAPRVSAEKKQRFSSFREKHNARHARSSVAKTRRPRSSPPHFPGLAEGTCSLMEGCCASLRVVWQRR